MSAAADDSSMASLRALKFKRFFADMSSDEYRKELEQHVPFYSLTLKVTGENGRPSRFSLVIEYESHPHHFIPCVWEECRGQFGIRLPAKKYRLVFTHPGLLSSTERSEFLILKADTKKDVLL